MELNPVPGESCLERFEEDGERERPSRELLRGLAMVECGVYEENRVMDGCMRTGQ